MINFFNNKLTTKVNINAILRIHKPLAVSFKDNTATLTHKK